MKATADDLRLDALLCFDLHAASRAMVQAYEPILSQLGVTYPQYLTLICLWEEDGATVGRLGERLHLDSGTLTPLIKRLAAHGLCERRRSAADERRVEIWLSASGRRLQRRALALQIGEKLMCRTGLTLTRARSLRAALRQLTSHIEETSP